MPSARARGGLPGDRAEADQAEALAGDLAPDQPLARPGAGGTSAVER